MSKWIAGLLAAGAYWFMSGCEQPKPIQEATTTAPEEEEDESSSSGSDSDESDSEEEAPTKTEE